MSDIYRIRTGGIFYSPGLMPSSFPSFQRPVSSRPVFSRDGDIHDRRDVPQALTGPSSALLSDFSPQYLHFIDQGTAALETCISSGRDRGLLAAAIGGREMVERFLKKIFLEDEKQWPHSALHRFPSREILIITRFHSNIKRWQNLLSRVFDQKGLNRDQFLWAAPSLGVRLESIESLARLSEKDLLKHTDKYPLIFVDQEHHVRGVEDQEEDRKRYIKVLQRLGLVEDQAGGYRAKESNKCMIGITSSVRAGAGCF